MPVAPTTSVEIITVVRPIRLLTMFSLVAAILCITISILSTSWLKSGSFTMGLLSECSSNLTLRTSVPNPPRKGTCSDVKRLNAIVKAVLILLICAAVLCFLAVGFVIIGIRNPHFNRKSFYYRIALVLTTLAILLEAAALVAVPIGFYFEVKKYEEKDINFGWSYAVAWGACLSTVFPCLLLICGKNHEEVHYKEKVIYDLPRC